MAATLGGLVFLGLVCALLLLLVKRMRGTRWVTVGEQVWLTVPSAEVPQRLAELGLGRVLTPAPDRAALVLRRSPVWVIAPMALLFPLGLLFLFYREDVSVEVTTDPAGDSAWLSGRTEARTLAAIRGALVQA
ncbi:hypothetical protein EFK50_02580 [Nocardioides marmoriginsengisoli]|uniref:Uncharacterized protein n=1 Tax=Nocardioides marmoriginsengisoli TaxID=661483 RepID=A0A3N0CN45_9ACTN|nr:hypothetical protein [Nocardioides marmoriginsengisoli]RNL64887.1 hypothetical protein EFK50_02580 [Nocardioides marmoriginsengisoli]